MDNGPIVIDLRGILRKRMTGWKKRLIPGWAIRLLERLICQDELNAMLRFAYPARGHEFSEKILSHLGISVETVGLDRLPKGDYVFASNHPLGGLDGIALVAVLGAKYGDSHLSVLVNDMLMNVEPLKDVFLPVNKYGSQGRAAAEAINAAYAEPGRQIVMFPAGLVSRLHPDGKIRDLEWQKAFVAKALSSGRMIVPVRFEGKNSSKFYKTALWRKKSGLKINVEQALLPSELVKARNKKFRIIFGTPVSAATMREQGMTPKEIAAEIRRLSDNLAQTLQNPQNSLTLQIDNEPNHEPNNKIID